MPIYAYRCTSCGFEKDVMQKVSEPRLTVCPECKTENFAKQLTAPGFQLKGTGWYATDFKGGGTAKAAVKTETSGETKSDSSSTPASDASSGNSSVPSAPTGTTSSTGTPAASSSAASSSPAK